MLSGKHFSQSRLIATAANNSTVWCVFFKIKKKKKVRIDNFVGYAHK